MDKLKPILVYKYWFVFVAAMILPTVGWWMATGEVSAQTETAISAAEGAFNTVPPSSSPNGTYSKAVQEINQELDRKNKTFNQYLWDVQNPKRIWPAAISEEMQALPYGAEIPVKTRRIYRIEYFRQLNEIPKIIDAFSAENPIGKVQFDLSTLTPQVSPADWGTSPPNSETMWEVQEDLWLVRSLLSAIAATNAGYDNILQTPIKQIGLITLRGGSKQAAAGTPAAGAEGAEGGGAEAGAIGGGGGLFGNKRGGGGRGGRGRGGIGFDPAEVFGPDALAGGAAGGGAEGGGADPAGGAGAFDAFGGGQQQAKRRRYIDDEEGAPFKTRGFYMELVIDHTKLTDLMVHLANLDWPVEIVRVQQEILNLDQVKIAAGGGGAVGARGGMGRGPRNRLGGGLGAAEGPGGAFGQRGGNDGDREKAAEGARMYSAAMMKSTLANVAIAGKMTIFQQPAESAEPAPEQPATPDGAANPDPSATTEPPASAEGEKKPDEGTVTDPAAPAATPNTTTPAGDPAESDAKPKTEDNPEETTPPATKTPGEQPKTENKPSEPQAADNK